MIIMTILFDSMVTAEFSESGFDDGTVSYASFPYEGFDAAIKTLKQKGIDMGCSGPLVYVSPALVDEIESKCADLGWVVKAENEL